MLLSLPDDEQRAPGPEATTRQCKPALRSAAVEAGVEERVVCVLRHEAGQEEDQRN